MVNVRYFFFVALFTLSVLLIGIHLYNSNIEVVLSNIAKSQISTGIYEVKQSEAEARDLITLVTISEVLNPGGSIYRYATWYRGYQTKANVEISVDIIPPQYYSCSWYDCIECSLYSYQYCSQYQCTIQSGTPYAICERDEIRIWKCTKSDTDYEIVEKSFPRTAYVRDGPDIFDFGDPDYIEFPIGMYPWDDLAANPAELLYYGIEIRWPATKSILDCIQNAMDTYYIYAFKVVIKYSDGTTQEETRLYDLYANYEWGNIIFYLPGSIFASKIIDKIELWERQFDIRNCYPQRDASISTIVNFVGAKPKTVTDVKYVTKTEKSQLERQGYTCVPHETVTTTKTYTGINSCDAVTYTTDSGRDGTCSGGVCYWYCNPEYECKPSPPRTRSSGTQTTTTTYTATNKLDLYNRGCSDAQISCTNWATKTGSLSEYNYDRSYKDARSVSCSQWAGTRFNSTRDATKVLGDPPFIQCTYKSQIFENVRTDAICYGPYMDTVSTPVKVNVGTITRTYYARTTDSFYIDLKAYENLLITVEGARFTNIPTKGRSTVAITIKAEDRFPYILSDHIEDISPQDGSYKAKKYVAIIYSPSDLIATFYPKACPEFEASDLKYIVSKLNDAPISKNPCTGALLYLRQGTNKFEMIGYSTELTGIDSCVNRPTTCEEEDLIGCPQQCYVTDLEVRCPRTMTISSGFGERTNIPISLIAKSEGIVRITIEGEGVVFIPSQQRLKIGTNQLNLPVTYYIFTNTSKKTIWRVLVVNPDVAKVGTAYKPEVKYCEMEVMVIPKEVVGVLVRPEIIIAAIIILVGVIIILLTRR
ncbi:MAG: hypothetical protein QXW13_00125 [Nanopusillaceae archaeon]